MIYFPTVPNSLLSISISSGYQDQYHHFYSISLLKYSKLTDTLSMSTLEDLDDLEREGKDDKKGGDDKDGKKSDQDGDAEMKDIDGGKKDEEKEEDLIDAEILHSSTRDINMRRRLLDNDMRIMKSEYQRLTHEQGAMKEKIKDNFDKIENNR